MTGPDRGGAAAWWFTRLAIRRAGGRAARLTPSRPRSGLALGGLVLGGGADVGPELYGADFDQVVPVARTEGRRSRARYCLALVFYPLLWLVRRILSTGSRARGNAARDEFELRLVRHATERGLPVLGICRGAQLLNVHFGGTLHQELDGFYTESPRIRTVLPRKRVRIASGSLLARVLGPDDCPVNALHRQAVNRVGDGLRVSAREANGVIQAIEHPRHPFVLGVQWHPEFLPQHRRQQAIFLSLVATASSRPDP